MSLRYRKRLLEHLRHDTYTPRRAEALVSDLKIDDPQDFAQALKDLEGEGIIHVSESGLIGLPSLAGSDEIIGTLRKNPKGFGFVQPETPMAEGDVFVPPESIGEALSGDTVRITIDPPDAKDYDDAISIKRTAGGWELAVITSPTSPTSSSRAARWMSRPRTAATPATCPGWSSPCSRRCSPTASARCRRACTGSASRRSWYDAGQGDRRGRRADAHQERQAADVSRGPGADRRRTEPRPASTPRRRRTTRPADRSAPGDERAGQARSRADASARA
jgi:hypothetical protein